MKRRTERLAVSCDHALDPVSAGRPTISSAVWLRTPLEPKTAAWSYTVPFEEKIDVESIGNDNDWKVRDVSVNPNYI